MLHEFKAKIEEKIGAELQWNRGDDIKFSKAFITLENVSIENETNWLQMPKFLADWTKEFFDVIVPYVKEVYRSIPLDSLYFNIIHHWFN